MIVTFASLLPRTGRPARSMREDGSAIRSIFSICAKVFLSFESMKSNVVVWVEVFNATGRVSNPGTSLGLTSPTMISTDGGMLYCERNWFSIRRFNGRVGCSKAVTVAGGCACAAQLAIRNKTLSDLNTQDNVKPS